MWVLIWDLGESCRDGGGVKLPTVCRITRRNDWQRSDFIIEAINETYIFRPRSHSDPFQTVLKTMLYAFQQQL